MMIGLCDFNRCLFFIKLSCRTIEWITSMYWGHFDWKFFYGIRVITKLPNTEQSSKGKVKTHKSTNRQNQSTTGKLGNRNGPDLVQAFLKKWWVESDFTAPNLPLALRFKGPFDWKSSIFLSLFFALYISAL